MLLLNGWTTAVADLLERDRGLPEHTASQHYCEHGQGNFGKFTVAESYCRTPCW
jgi:hypothetical protein